MPSRRSAAPLGNRLNIVVLLALGVVLVAPGLASADGNEWSIEILSGAPDQVSGGDALVQVGFPGKDIKVDAVLLLNGEDVTGSIAPDGEDLVGVVEGFTLGDNLLQLKPSAASAVVMAELVARNHPDSGPIFSGPQQQPFVCTTARADLGQPLVDNQDEIGIPVAQEDENGNYPSDGRGYPTAGAEIVGWSQDCAGETRLDYLYRTTGGSFQPLAGPGGPLPSDIAMTTTLDGQTVPYIVRWERGTNNRFIYSVAMLAPTSETDPSVPDDSLWNGRLVFSLQGGVAIGRTQGSTSTSARLPDAQLRLGYAVVNSTGLRTNTHYNLQLGGETALMLKEHFIEDHGVPLYTVGVGGSGGAIQQYVYAQNHPGLIDAAVPIYSYSDMITQTIHVGDCELLEYYFDATDRFNPKWQDVLNRRAIEGLNASRSPINMSSGEEGQWNLLYFLYSLLGFSAPVPESPPTPAITECRRAGVGLPPREVNPTNEDVSDLDKLAQGTAGVEWTHAGDLVNIYGVDETGFARTPWGNAGVQYGLQALTGGMITPAEFLDLNAQVGSWKPSEDTAPEGFPFVGGFDPFNFDPWSARNINLSPDGGVTPAPRRSGDLAAINAAYDSGMRFDGDIDIPVIDWRHYLEEELDMHHSHQSFATRRRFELGRGNADNQVIWFVDARPFAAFDPTPEAFEVIDEWMANLRANPELGVAGNRPPGAVDRCLATDGTEIAAGDDVWNGILDTNPAGTCTQQFQIHRTTRIVAGGPIEGGIFQCGFKSVDQAISDGDYGPWSPTAAERARLTEIFPAGVCDWSQPDAGRPAP
ncbi:MAG: DUF6351 family protein [Proteobacteria bacterium]|nr:DUF6351 family protein [Pseudomonadota bacterium]